MHGTRDLAAASAHRGQRPPLGGETTVARGTLCDRAARAPRAKGWARQRMLRPQKRRGHPWPLEATRRGAPPAGPYAPLHERPPPVQRAPARRARGNRRSKPSAPPAARRRPQAPSRLEREHFARGRPPERDESAVWPPVRTWTRRRLSRANSPRPRPRVAFARAVELRLRRGWRTIRNAPRRRQPAEWSTCRRPGGCATRAGA